MKIEIDQSGKIENTNHLTVIAFSNKINKSILITAKDKKSLQSVFRRINQPRIFISKVFAAAIFLLLKNDFKNLDIVIIDTEYPGHENTIRKYLNDFFNQGNYRFEKLDIHFKNIGKRSKAHDIAWKSYRRKRADFKASAQDLLQVLFK